MKRRIGTFLAAAFGAIGAAPVAGAEVSAQEIIESEELRSHLALVYIKAHRAYERGLSGQGVVIAVIDTGVDPENLDIAPNLSPLSTDIVERRGSLKGGDPHGLGVALLAAGAYNGERTMGVAHGATILAIRADNEQGCAGECLYRSQELAAAILYAVENGAAVINLSLGGPSAMRAPVVEALKHAADAGVIMVASGGNNRRSQPNYPARHAPDEGIAGMMVVAGPHDDRGRRAAVANRAGVAVDWFISAPGPRSSMSVAYVSGALALLREAYPDLPPRETVLALLEGARDAGESGPDRDFGWGLLDIEGALERAAVRAAAYRAGAR